MTKQNIRYQWLAGLIDGDGCFLVSSKSYGSLEITVSSDDETMLQKIKQEFGGSIKPRPNLKALRYRLHHAPGLKKLLHSVNGQIRNSVRQPQFKKILDLFNIKYIEHKPFNWQSAYASGLFDSDGCVVLSVKQHNALKDLQQKTTLEKIQRLQAAKKVQLSLKITQKYKTNVEFLITPMFPCYENCSTKEQLKSFGNIHFDKAQNGYYNWYISSKKHILQWLQYTTIFPCYSKKKVHRLGLIKTFYKLYGQKVHLADKQSYLKRRWNNFATHWYSYDK
jgi:LAGLIDADG endonuclease